MSKNVMKKTISAIPILCMLFALSACGTSANPSQDTNTQNSDVSEKPETTEKPSEEPSKDTKILIAFFSRADENYGVGIIEKGNTHIIAEMIAEKVGGDLFHIERSTPYPAEYRACTDEAKKEQNDSARPELKATIEISDYDVIYLGYPNWWDDMPMPVYTFIESQDWNGKTVIPFCTHAGSGLSGTVNTLKNKCTGATVLEGLAVAGTTAQNDRTAAEQAVDTWLEKVGN